MSRNPYSNLSHEELLKLLAEKDAQLEKSSTEIRTLREEKQVQKELMAQETERLQGKVYDLVCSVNKNSPVSPAKRTTRVGIFDVTQNGRGRGPWVDLPWGGAPPRPVREAAKAAPIRCSVPFPAPCFLMCHCEERSDVAISQYPAG